MFGTMLHCHAAVPCHGEILPKTEIQTKKKVKMM
jgi:hypothetical protein